MEHVYVNGFKLIKKYKVGKKVMYLLENNEVIAKEHITIVEAECPACGLKRRLKTLSWHILNNATLCSRCNALGSRNPFFGKRHSPDIIKKMSKQKTGKYTGDKNPMYGKSVFDRWVELYGNEEALRLETIRNNKLSIAGSGEKNGFFGKKHSDKAIATIVNKTREWRNNLTEEEKKLYLKSFQIHKKE